MNAYAEKVYTDAHNRIWKRLIRLEEMKLRWKKRYEERYPYDAYGIKGELLYENKAMSIDQEIKELRPYLGLLDELKRNDG